MKPAMELRQGSTYRKDGVPYIILKAERHQSTSGKRQRAAEMKFKIRDLISGKTQEIIVLTTEIMDGEEMVPNEASQLNVNSCTSVSINTPYELYPRIVGSKQE